MGKASAGARASKLATKTARPASKPTSKPSAKTVAHAGRAAQRQGKEQRTARAQPKQSVNKERHRPLSKPGDATRLIQAKCRECGDTFRFQAERTQGGWIVDKGADACPTCKAPAEDVRVIPLGG